MAIFQRRKNQFHTLKLSVAVASIVIESSWFIYFLSPLKPDLSLFICTVKLKPKPKPKLNFKSSECSFRMQQTRIFADVMCDHNMFNQGRGKKKKKTRAAPFAMPSLNPLKCHVHIHITHIVYCHFRWHFELNFSIFHVHSITNPNTLFIFIFTYFSFANEREKNKLNAQISKRKRMGKWKTHSTTDNFPSYLRKSKQSQFLKCS